MRLALPVFVALFSLLPAIAFAEELKPEEVLKAIRDMDLEVDPDDAEELKTDDELLTFDQAKDEVIWVRVYDEKEKITQVYTIAKDRMKVKEGVVIIPLIWVSMANPAERNYNPDKHDVGIRVVKEKGKYIVNFYAIDSKGKEVEITFLSKKK